jgi:hypothetical protein
MAEQANLTASEDTIQLDLRNATLAAVWAWLWPGAGHLYQRRYAKGVLFMVCILGTYFFGLTLGGGHVVYASWTKGDRRWQYICQLGVGAPALPALVQSRRVRSGKEPLWADVMAPPREVAISTDESDDLSDWHLVFHSFFELGTLYTMIAGLLNVLAVCDAYAGPVIVIPQAERDRPPPSGKRKRSE